MQGDNKSILVRAIEDYLFGLDEGASAEVYAADCIAGAPDSAAGRFGLAAPLDPDSVRNHRLMFKLAFPDMEFRVDEIIEEGDRVAARWTVRGDDCGNPEARRIRSHLELPESDFSVSGVAFCRLKRGKIVEIWQLSEMMTLAKCLGDGGLAGSLVHG